VAKKNIFLYNEGPHRDVQMFIHSDIQSDGRKEEKEKIIVREIVTEAIQET
jgi:hypothetical protein